MCNIDVRDSIIICAIASALIVSLVPLQVCTAYRRGLMGWDSGAAIAAVFPTPLTIYMYIHNQAPQPYTP